MMVTFFGGAPVCVVTPGVNTKTMDGSADGQFSTTNTGTITLTTTLTNDVIVLMTHTDHFTPNASRSIATVTSPNLTWHFRAAQTWTNVGTFISDTGRNTMEIWWATAAAALTAEVITVTVSVGNVDNMAMQAFGVHGSPTPSSPWDTNASLPAFNKLDTTGTPLTVSGVYTDSNGPTILGSIGSASTNNMALPPGMTQVRPALINPTGVLWAQEWTFYQTMTSNLCSHSFTSTPLDSVWGMYIDALK